MMTIVDRNSSPPNINELPFSNVTFLSPINPGPKLQTSAPVRSSLAVGITTAPIGPQVVNSPGLLPVEEWVGMISAVMSPVPVTLSSSISGVVIMGKVVRVTIP